MTEFIKLNYSNIQQTLSSTNHGPLTVLLISDSAFHNLPTETVSDLQLNPAKLISVIYDIFTDYSVEQTSGVFDDH